MRIQDCRSALMLVVGQWQCCNDWNCCKLTWKYAVIWYKLVRFSFKKTLYLLCFNLKMKLNFCRYILLATCKNKIANCACLGVCLWVPTCEFSSDVADFHYTVPAELSVHPSDIFSFFMQRFKTVDPNHVQGHVGEHEKNELDRS